MKNLTVVIAADAQAKVPDLETWGDADGWKLICKASSNEQGWMKSTKAMQIEGLGCLVQVTTQQDDNVAEAVTFVPFSTIIEEFDQSGKLIGRRLAVQTQEGFSYG